VARFTTSITTHWLPERAFDYLADVRNLAQWDPGVRRAQRLAGRHEPGNLTPTCALRFGSRTSRPTTWKAERSLFRMRSPARPTWSSSRFAASNSAARVRDLRMLAPVRPGGTAALLRGAPDADVVLVTHLGLEPLQGAATFGAGGSPRSSRA
jgi:hypothetical protein